MNIDPIRGFLGPNIPASSALRKKRTPTSQSWTDDSVVFVIPDFETDLFEQLSKELDAYYSPVGGMPSHIVEAAVKPIETRLTSAVLEEAGVVDFVVGEIILKSPDLSQVGVERLGKEAIYEMCKSVLEEESYWPAARMLNNKVGDVVNESYAHVDGYGLGGSTLFGLLSPEVSTIVMPGLAMFSPDSRVDGSLGNKAQSYVGPAVDQDGNSLLERLQPHPGSLILLKQSSSVHDFPAAQAQPMQAHGILRHLYNPTWDFEEIIEAVNQVIENPITGVDLADQLRTAITAQRQAALTIQPAQSFLDDFGLGD